MLDAQLEPPRAHPSPEPSGGSHHEISLGLVHCTAIALLLHVATGYRPFPSLDDFAYLPVFLHQTDPSAYASDAVLQSMSLHSLGWYWVFRLAQATVGMARGFWLMTLGLSIATVAATSRIAQTIGASQAVLPFIALLAFGTSLHGVGRGVYDGAFGAGFHGQWLALCFLLFAYDAFLRGHPFRTGAYLGLTILAHLSVAIHGAFVLALATAITGQRRIRSLLSTASVSAIIGFPAIRLVLSHLAQPGDADWPTKRLVEQGYIFRLPHEYTMDLGHTGNIGAALLLLAGFAGVLILKQRQPSLALSRLATLGVGHLLLLGLALVFYGPLAEISVLPYMLSLTRTSPLLVVGLSIAAIAGLERYLHKADDKVPFQLLAAAAILMAVALELRLFVEWGPSLLVLVGVTPVLALSGIYAGQPSHRALLSAIGLTIVGASALATSVHSDVLEDVPVAATGQLFGWSRASTPQDAVFIIPPGLEAFRWFAQRSAYVDFKLFPPASIESISTWRQRLEDVASPDRRALALAGWRASREFDRCYATRNTPERIRDLLIRTGASYFVWDSDGLRIPPLTTPSRSPVEDLEESFRNERYTVYHLREKAR